MTDKAAHIPLRRIRYKPGYGRNSPGRPRVSRQPSRQKTARNHIIDGDGRKIGHMWPEDFIAMAETMWGKYKWRGEYARFAGVGIRTVHNFTSGLQPIPRVHAQLMTYRYHYYITRGRAYPNNEAPWLAPDWVPYGDTIPAKWDDDEDDD